MNSPRLSSSLAQDNAPVDGPSVWRFFAITLGLSLVAELFPVLAHFHVIAGPEGRFMALVGIGALCPLTAAAWCSRGAQGGVRGLFAQLGIARVGAHWYLVALLLPGSLLVLGLSAYRLIGRDPGPFLYLPVEPERMVATVLFSFGEEVGWRGYALPRLRKRCNDLQASLVLGSFWAAWHVPMFIIAGMPLVAYPIAGVYLLAGSVTMTWIYRNTRGSLLLAVMAHMGAHLNNANRPLPGNTIPLAVTALAYTLFAACLVLAQRKQWLGSPTPDQTWRFPTPC